MLKPTLTLAAQLALTLLLASAAQANNCDAIRADIDARVRANGIGNHSLSVLDRAALAPGRVVGTCDQGSKKILMTQPGLSATAAAPGQAAAGPVAAAAAGHPSSSQPAPSRRETRRSITTDDILTECRDGSIVTGPDCSKTRSAGAAASAAAHNPKLP